VGYDSSMFGGLHVDPPLSWSEFKDSPYYPVSAARAGGKSVCLVETSETVETDDGPLERRQAAEVVFAWTYPVKLYDLLDHIQALVDAHPGHEFTGMFHGEGADFGDIWRVYVNADRKVVRELPLITWPDGSVLRNTRYP
jgi:hypothetical protein